MFWKKKIDSRPILAIDLDDTLSDFASSWIRIYNAHSGDTLSKDMLTNWDISKFVKPEWKEKIYELLTNRSTYVSIVNGTIPNKGAIEATKRLQEFFDIYVVTATHPSNFHQKIKWMNFYFPHIPSVNIISMCNKSLFAGDYLVDDNAKTVFDFPKTGIIYTQPWNKKSFSFFVPRYSNWERLERYLMREWRSKWQNVTQSADGSPKNVRRLKNTPTILE